MISGVVTKPVYHCDINCLIKICLRRRWDAIGSSDCTIDLGALTEYEFPDSQLITVFHNVIHVFVIPTNQILDQEFDTNAGAENPKHDNSNNKLRYFMPMD